MWMLHRLLPDAPTTAPGRPSRLAPRSRWQGTTTIVFALSLLAVTVHGVTTAPVPRLDIVAPESMANVARQIASIDRSTLAETSLLLGLDESGPPVRVVLLPESSKAAQRLPRWVAGYADGIGGTITLFPARTPSYPVGSLEALLRHELAHVLAARVTGGRRIPRWFNEGVATIAGRQWNLSDTARTSVALLRGPSTFAEVDRAFFGAGAEARAAYALSAAVVHDLMRRHGPETPGEILREVGRGHSFPTAFRTVTGTSLRAAESSFWKRQRRWQWIPVVTSGAFLWLAITGLALVAIAVRRRRSAALHARWAEEESIEIRRRLRLVHPKDRESDFTVH